MKKEKHSDIGQSVAVAYMWVGRIMSICGVMVLPAVAGMWLDNEMETTPVFTLGGFAFGMTVALVMLLKLNTAEDVSKKNRKA